MQKILISKRRALGDTVLLSSTVAVIKKMIPNSEIHVLAPSGFISVFDHNPFIKRAWAFKKATDLGLFWNLRKEKFDLIFDLHSSPSSRLYSKLLGSKKLYSQMQNFETEKKYGKHPNALEWDILFLKYLGFSPSVAEDPKIFLNEVELTRAKEFWKNQGVDPQRTVFLGLGASRPTKRWLPEHFARLAELLRDRADFTSAIIVGPADEEAQFASRVLDYLRIKGFKSVSSKEEKFLIYHFGMSVRELAAVLATCKMYIGNDSGPKHLALAVGTRTLTIFGPEDPMEWHPYDREKHPVFYSQSLACRKEDNGRWCGITTCIQEKHRCMRYQLPEDVFAVFERMK